MKPLPNLIQTQKELIKLIYDNMGGKRLSDKISDSIFNLINSISYEQAIDKIKRAESKDSKSGIITTAKELKSLDIIKTIVAMTSKINNKEIDRIGHKDYKGQFKIIVDNMPSKEICHIVIKDSKKYISINDKEYHIESVSAKEITKHRRHLVECNQVFKIRCFYFITLSMSILKEIIENNSTPKGKLFDYFIQVLIVLSLISLSIETLPDLSTSTREFCTNLKLLVL